MIFRNRKQLLISIAIALLLLAQGLKAQTAEEYLKSYLIDFYQSEDGQREIVSRLDIPRDRQDIYLDYISDLFNEVALLEDLAQNLTFIIGDATLAELEQLKPIFAEVGFGIAANAVGEGMQRLPPSEVRILLAHDLANTQNLPRIFGWPRLTTNYLHQNKHLLGLATKTSSQGKLYGSI